MGANLKNCSCRLKEQNRAGPSALERTNCLQVWNKILPYKKAFLRIVPIKGIWVAVFKTCSDCTGLLPRRACLYHYYMCNSGTLLPSDKTYKAWVWHIFFRCGSKSQKLLMSLEGTKTCGSFGPRVDKLLAGLEQNPSPQQYFHNKSLVVNCYWVLIGTTTLNYALKNQQTKN